MDALRLRIHTTGIAGMAAIMTAAAVACLAVTLAHGRNHWCCNGCKGGEGLVTRLSHKPLDWSGLNDSSPASPLHALTAL
jgi:hypothetical protein